MSAAKNGFFRQSAWLAAATVLGGAFMTAVHPVASQMGDAEYGVLGVMLRLFLLLGIPSGGLQVVFAQRSAAAVTPELQRRLAGTARGVLCGIAVVWSALAVVTVVWSDAIARRLNLPDATVLWPTLAAAFTWLALPVFKGLLQGRQEFGTLGWIGILDGAGRLGAMVVVVLGFHGHAAGAMGAVAFGQALSFVVALRATRSVWLDPGAEVDWSGWIRLAVPYTAGAAGLLVLSLFDLVYLQAAIPAAQAKAFSLGQLYLPAATIGFALTQITVPLAMVMFPKIARSVATGVKSDALALALSGTALLGACGWIATLALPKLPLQMLYFRTPANWAAAPLVPWCVFAMLSYVLANVLVTDHLARARFAVVPWVVAIAAAYVSVLVMLRPTLLAMEPLAAYRLVASVVGGANLLLLAVAAVHTWGGKRGRSTAGSP